jgi:enamine deaminase RidA (YjgF/YER057c/UK114 family)
VPEQRDPSRKREAFIPSVWSAFYEETGVPAAVRSGRTLYVTGHTGESADGVFPTDVEAQVRGTFLNIELTLAEAGLGWHDVVALNSYHVGFRDQVPVLLAVAAEFLAEPFPAWTAVGVTELIAPEAVIEISCVAVAPASC